jgi:hypothetical protein
VVEDSHDKSNEGDDVLDHKYLIAPIANWSSCGEDKPKKNDPSREAFRDVSTQSMSLTLGNYFDIPVGIQLSVSISSRMTPYLFQP